MEQQRQRKLYWKKWKLERGIECKENYPRKAYKPGYLEDLQRRRKVRKDRKVEDPARQIRVKRKKRTNSDAAMSFQCACAIMKRPALGFSVGTRS